MDGTYLKISLSQTPDIQYIGSVVAEDLNGAAMVPSTTETVTFVGGKSANKYVDGVFFKNVEAFNGYSYGSESTITGISGEALLNSNIGNENEYEPDRSATSIVVTVTFDPSNPEDWTQGEIECYVLFKNYPNI